MEPLLSKALQQHQIPGRVIVSSGLGGLPKINITTDFSTAEIYLHGAHVTGFQKNDEPPLLFMSDKSLFAADKAIRGGVPICFPWFGSREGLPAHGFARVTAWDLVATTALPDGDVSVRFQLPETAGGANAFRAKTEFIVTVNTQLTLELRITNTSGAPLNFEECLHAYFFVGDINDISITGLKGVTFLDKTENNARKLESGEALKIINETDRVFLNTTGEVEIHDAKLGRKIRVEKINSASTVVWNPWATKAKAMSDFGDQEYKQMVCVEAGNVGQSRITLTSGQTSSLKMILNSHQC